MTTPALVVQGVGKAYVKYRSELQRVACWLGVFTRPLDEHWVIRGIDFRVNAGESLGIIGQNGAGKSTLLKIITGTTRPTEGVVALTGYVSALLELGLGFNQELTGRENAVYSAGLRGFSKEQIDQFIPQIEEFAEIGEYFDQPMRTYSSGMQMRVAFSVATVVRPEILIVDEALSVGDSYFVHKCFKRIREFREAGTTLLIVSHDASAIQTLCDRAILLDGGRIVLDGEPQEVLDYYNALIAEKENSKVRTARTSRGSVATESGTGEALIETLTLLDAKGQPVEYVEVGQPVSLSARIKTNAPVKRLVFGYLIRDRLGQKIFGTNTHYTDQVFDDLQAGECVEVRAHFLANRGPGSYSISVARTGTETHVVKNYQWRDLALVFTVTNAKHPTFVGAAWIPPRMEVLRHELHGSDLPVKGPFDADRRS